MLNLNNRVVNEQIILYPQQILQSEQPKLIINRVHLFLSYILVVLSIVKTHVSNLKIKFLWLLANKTCSEIIKDSLFIWDILKHFHFWLNFSKTNQVQISAFWPIGLHWHRRSQKCLLLHFMIIVAVWHYFIFKRFDP